LFISLLAQRNEPKKGQPDQIGPALRDCPHNATENGRFGKSLRSAKTFIPFSVALLGKLIMG